MDLVFVPFYVGWHRLILLASATVHFRTVFLAGARDRRYCGYFLVVLLPLYAFGLGTASAIDRVAGGSFQGAHIVVTVAVVALAFAWLSVRLAFLLVETTIDRPTSLAAGWRSTRGFGRPLLVLFLATMAPKWLLHAVALAPLLALHGSAPALAVTALLNVIWAVLTAVFGAVWVSAMSYAYRDATGYRPPDLETLF